MSWAVGNQRDIPGIETFLLKHEWRCAQFSANFREEKVFSPRYNILVNQKGGSIEEMIMLTPWGMILPVLQPQSDLSCLSLYNNPTLLLNNFNPLHMIMGVRRDVRQLEEVIDRQVSRYRDYFLMILWREQFQAPPPHAETSLTIHQARPRDFKRLFPLQAAYEKEEVCLDIHNFNDVACLVNLKQTLMQQLVFYAQNQWGLVAKGGTNARGIEVDQIGGVFTLRRLRGQGIALQVMGRLLAKIFETKSQVALFVKEENQAAVGLYRKLGFNVVDFYRISYYKV